MKKCLRHVPFRVFGVIRNVTTGLPITGGLASLDSKLVLAGGLVTTVNAPVEIGTTGHVYVDLTASEMGHYVLRVIFSATNSGAVPDIVDILPELAIDSGVATSATPNTIQLRSGAPTTGIAGQMISIVGGMGVGQSRCVISYAPPICTVDRNWEVTPNNTSEYMIEYGASVRSTGSGFAEANVTRIYSDQTAAFNLSLVYGTMPWGQVNDTAPTVSSFKGNSGMSSANDYYTGMVVQTSSGIMRRVSGYTGATRQVVVSPPLPTAPPNNSYFVFLGKID